MVTQMQKYPEFPPGAKALLDIANQRDPFFSRGINTEQLWEFAVLHEMTPLVFNALKNDKDRVPQRLYDVLKSDYLNSCFRNTRFWNEFLNINGELGGKNISIVPIKGVDMLARFYPASDLRTMADIDILVAERDFVRTQDALLGMGYQKKLDCLKEEYWRKKQCHVAFTKGDFMVEVHWGLDFKRGKTTLLPALWKRVKEVARDNHRIKILSAEDALFAFALHLRRFGNILSLKRVFDAARIINESPEFDWNYLLEESRAGKSRATLYFLLTQVRLFAPARIPEDFCGKLDLARWQKRMIENFIGAHTFQTHLSLKNDYLKAHFLLYDSLREPVCYLLKIPYEQFCKFYALKPYVPKTDLYYRLRLLYMPLKQILR
jgi:hypothetical protein